MFNEQRKQKCANRQAAVRTLVIRGYINIQGAWIRGFNEAAVIEVLPTGRALIKEGTNV